MNDIMKARVQTLTPEELEIIMRSFYDFVKEKYGFEYDYPFEDPDKKFKDCYQEWKQEELYGVHR